MSLAALHLEMSEVCQLTIIQNLRMFDSSWLNYHDCCLQAVRLETVKLYLTFMGPCFVIHFYSKTK